MLRALLLSSVLAVGTAGPATVSRTLEVTVAPAASRTPREATVLIQGAKFHYYVLGDLASNRTPLLILHGAYMSAENMMPLAERFAATLPVILMDQRGHGRTGDVAGPITYERLGDDVAAVIEAAGAPRVDVLGYSLGGGAAIQLAIRHPQLVAKLVSISASYSSDGMNQPEGGGSRKISPSMFDDTPLRRNYDRLTPDPKSFPILVDKINALQALPQRWPAEQIKAIGAPTMIIVGDHDIIRPEHAVDMYRLRGGADANVVATGFLAKAPAARLAILPGTGHLNVVAQPDLIVSLVTPFLDDATPTAPAGFF
jgi:pimeloyl-ACP methyl ester carboxylesterase